MENPWKSPGVLRGSLIGLFILFQVHLIFIKRHDALDLDIAPNTQPTERIYQDNRVGQTFVARRDRLARIDVAMGTYDRHNDQDIFFRLWQVEPERRLVREKVFNASSVKNNLYYSIGFKPVGDSRGKKYYFVFSSPGSTYENSISVWMNPQNIYPEGDYYFRHKPARGDLIFRVYSRQPIFAELRRIVRGSGGAFVSLPFLITAIVLFEIVLTVFFSKLLGLIWRIRSSGTW